MKYGIIYKATNTITDMVYIGATTKSLEERKDDHTQKANTAAGGYFQEAIGTYGLEVFVWEQITTASDNDDLARKEIYYIQTFNAIQNGYNRDRGGGFNKTVYRYDLGGNYLDSYPDLSSAAAIVGSTTKAISQTCLGPNKPYRGFIWSYNQSERLNREFDSRKKRVFQYDLKGSIVAEFESASEASRQTGVSKVCITRCCRGERSQSGGFRWEYI